MSNTRTSRFQIRSYALRVAVAGLLVVGYAFTPGCSINDQCELSDARCDGNVAVGCAENTGKGLPGNVIITTNCAAPTTCFAGADYAVCALKADSCDPATFVQRCEGEVPVVCTDPGGDSEGKTFEIMGVPCSYGNTCIAGGCADPADMMCDPKTYMPTCDAEGRSLLCVEMGEANSGRFRVARIQDTCKDGNQCFSGPNYVGCGSTNTTCDRNTFKFRCEGNSVIQCGDAYMQDAAAPVVGLEYALPCPNGCGDVNGVTGCL